MHFDKKKHYVNISMFVETTIMLLRNNKIVRQIAAVTVSVF